MKRPFDKSPSNRVTEPRWRTVTTSPAVAAVAVVAVIAAATTAAAADRMTIFRTQQVAPVSVSHDEMVALPDLGEYGEFDLIDEPKVREVRDAESAESASGLTAPEVGELPHGVSGEPTYLVGDQTSAEFTFSAARAEEAAASAGEELPSVPAGLDGSTFRLTAGPGVAAVWLSNNDVPALAIAHVVAPTTVSTGVPFATARDYLLKLPGVSPKLEQQLRDISGDGVTLPLLIPSEVLDSSTADVGGNEAIVLTSSDGAFAAVMWVHDGTITAVAGSLSADEVLAVARGLQPS